MVRVMMRVNDDLNGRMQAIFGKTTDLQGFFRVQERIDQDRTR
jgi:hypothetical protein